MSEQRKVGALWVIVAVVVAAAISVAATALASNSRTKPVSTARHHKLQVFELEEGGFDNHETVAADGLSSGEQIIEHKDILDPSTSKKLGESADWVAILQTLPKDDALYDFDCTLFLGADRLLISGSGRLSELATGAAFPIVGGTGRYAGASGVAVIKGGQKLGAQSGYGFALDFTTSR
jgi:hypothetical protein